MCWLSKKSRRKTWQLNVIIIYIKKKNIKLKSVRWILQYKGFFYLRILCWPISSREKGLSKSPFNTFLFPSSSSPTASVLALFPSLSPWLLFGLSSYFCTSQSSAFEVAGPQVGSSERWQNRTGSLTSVASSKQPSAPGPAALNGAGGREGAPSCGTYKVHGRSGSQIVTHIYWACPSDSLSEAYNFAKSTFVFMRTVEWNSSQSNTLWNVTSCSNSQTIRYIHWIIRAPTLPTPPPVWTK